MLTARDFSLRGTQYFELILLLSSISFCTLQACAHETDNFYLPLDAELADLSDFVAAVHTRAIEEAVMEINTEIERAIAMENAASRAKLLERCHDPEKVAAAVASRFGDAFTETVRAERALKGDWAKRSYPGKKSTNHSIWMNFAGHFLLDPRALIMLAQADTLKAYGVYFGADKLTHFHQLGWSYYKLYHSLRRDGLSEKESYYKVLQRYSNTAFLAEKKMFGIIGTGVYSNADMAANHMGFKFYVNLTEKVVLKGREREPLVVRCGVFWRVNDHVRPQSGWLGAFVSDHWNEALNPSLYDATMRPGIRRVLRSRAGPIVRFYTEKDGRPNDPAYFDNLSHDLATYEGEAYGHSKRFDKLMNIGNTCYPRLTPQVAHN
jgi:hypothetical protein